MKKLLIKGVVLSVFVISSAYAVGNYMSSKEEETALKQPNQDISSPLEQKSANVSKATIEEVRNAVSSLLSFKGFITDSPLQVDQDGEVFWVHVPEMKVDSTEGQPLVFPSYKLEVKQNGTFADYPQYAVSVPNTSILEQSFSGLPLSISADSYTQKILWVPELKLVSNMSLKSDNFKLSYPEEGIGMSINKIVSDMLVRLVAEKLEGASSTDVRNIVFQTPMFTLEIPQSKQTMHFSGADLSGDETVQILTANQVVGTLSIPTVSIISPLAPDQKLSASINGQVSIKETIEIDTTVDHISNQNNLFPLMPQDIVMKLSIAGMDKKLLLEMIQLQEEMNLTGKEDPVALSRMNQIQDKLLQSTVVEVKDFSIMNADTGIGLVGKASFKDNSVEAQMDLRVVNFDVLSPKPAPIDPKKCEEAQKAFQKSPDDQVLLQQLIVACENDTSKIDILSGLRPYLKTAKHSKDEKGRLVDTFTIRIEKDQIVSINGEPYPLIEQKVSVSKE